MDVNIFFRIITLIVLVTAFSISAYYRRAARETGETIDRREEGSLVLILRLIFGLFLLALLLLNIFFPQALTWSKFELPLSIRLIGAAISIISVLLILWVFRSIGRNISETVLTKQDHELVTSGPYRWVRHPLYSSALLLIFTIGLMLGDWVLLLFSLVGTVVFRFMVIPAEEEKLVALFGEEYEKYKNQSGALIPKIN